jgi:hypothetical protein
MKAISSKRLDKAERGIHAAEQVAGAYAAS